MTTPTTQPTTHPVTLGQPVEVFVRVRAARYGEPAIGIPGAWKPATVTKLLPGGSFRVTTADGHAVVVEDIDYVPAKRSAPMTHDVVPFGAPTSPY